MMPSSRIPSPARSQGVNSTPRRYKPRASRSVGSPARSNTSVKLSAMVQMENFTLSPMPSRRSVLPDNTDIDMPTRRSWWKKLDDNSREVMDVLNNEIPVQGNNAIEEYIDIDVLSQEKEKNNYMLDLPESSDGESINSIVIPQRKLFTQKDVVPQRKFKQILDNRESLAKLNKSQRDYENTLNVGRKNLFNQGTKQRSKPLFPSALLNVSLQKTADKTKDFASTDINSQVKSLFGNRGGMKRKNMFADFIVSESEDEIPEIQAKVFGFQKKAEQKRRKSLKLRGTHESHFGSPTSSITETEMDDWKLLPSSTMVDHQIEDGLRTTPSKRARLSKASEAIESIIPEANVTANKIKASNKSTHFKNLSKSKNIEVNDLAHDKTDNNELIAIDRNKSFNASAKNVVREQSLQKLTSKTNRHSKSKSISLHKSANEVAKDTEDKYSETSEKNMLNENKTLKTLSRIDQALQSDDDEDFSLVYENDEQICENKENEVIIGNEASNLTKSLKGTSAQRVAQFTDHSSSQNPSEKLQNKSIAESLTHQNEKSKIKDKDDINTVDQRYDLGDKQADVVNEINHRNESHFKSVTQEIESDVENMPEDQNLCSADRDEEQDTHDDEESVSHEEESDIEKEIQNDIAQEIQTEEESDIDEENLNIELSKNGHKEGDDNNEENIEDRENDNQAKQEESNNTNENHDVVDNVITNSLNKDTHESRNNLHDKAKIKETTIRNKQIHEQNIPSPEMCRKHNKTSEIESFTAEGRKTDVRRTKSNIKNLTIRQSLVPLRESVGFSDGSRNSSAEGSGWDSHRTTRATLRQTFGKDFTPRKSLRALVMENSAKRRTNLNEINAEFSRFPQANSTELPINDQLDFGESDASQKINKSNHEASRDMNHLNAEHKLRNTRDNQQDIYPTDGKALNKSELKLPLGSKKMSNSDNASKVNESNNKTSADIDAQKLNDSGDHEVSLEMDDEDCVPEINCEDSNNTKINDSGDEQDMYEPDQEASCNEDADDGEEINESDNAQKAYESDQEVSYDNDDAQEMIETDDEQEKNESDQEVSYDNDDAQEMNETDDKQEKNESNQEVSSDENTDDTHEINESNHVLSRDIEDAEESQEMNETDDALEKNTSDIEESNAVYNIVETQGINDSDNEHEMNESDQEMSHDVDNAESNESDGEQENFEANREASSDDDDGEENNEIHQSNKVQETNELDYTKESNESDREYSGQQDVDVEIEVTDREESRKTRQTTLEMYLQKIKNRKLERKKQLVDDIMNTLKAPSRDILNPFKVPAIPKLRRMKTQQINSKPKPLKSSVITMEMLPAEVLEDMKYKPPKRYRPTNASWITKRLYKFLETKLEPKYDYKARVRSEKLVETIYNFVKDIKRHQVAPAETVDELKREMARLDVVKTHVEFYEFFHEYMPREVRVKVVPDLFNKISLPKRGVFSDILR